MWPIATFTHLNSEVLSWLLWLLVNCSPFVAPPHHISLWRTWTAGVCSAPLVLPPPAPCLGGAAVNQPARLSTTGSPGTDDVPVNETRRKREGRWCSKINLVFIFCRVWEIFTWARNFCFSASSEPKCADNANITWMNDKQKQHTHKDPLII